MLRRLTLGLVVLGLAAAVAACSSDTNPINGGSGTGPNFATNSVYAAIASTNAISIYPAPIGTTLTPSYQIGGSTTTLDGPQYMTFDAAGNLWTTNYDAGTGVSSVIVFKVLATGAVYPLQTLTYAGMGQPRGIAIDANGNVAVAAVYSPAVSPALPSQIQFFTVLDAQGTTPYQVISGPSTGLNVPSGIAYDTNGTLYVANRQGASVEAFAFPTPSPTPAVTPTPSPTPTATPTPGSGPTPTPSPTPSPVPLATNQPPTLDIVGATTGLTNPSGVAVDSTGIIYVSDAGNASIRIFAAGSTGNVAPTRVISGALTLLQVPTDIKVDSTGKIYVADSGAGKIFVFAAGATGNVAPTTTLTSSTGLVGIGLSP
jgi:sugar lactone lactonase YvrE